MLGRRAKRVGRLTTVFFAGLIVVSLQAGDPLALTIVARHDVPGPVDIQVQGWDKTGTLVAQETLSWTDNDNHWSVKTALVSSSAATYRFTFLNDYCGPGCPEDPDADRNAHIDYFWIGGAYFEGEDFDLTGGTDPQFPGCSVETVDGKVTATCGNENDWVEYTFPARDILIVDTTRRNAIFGMYQFNRMTEPAWDLYARTVDWAITYDDHATTKIWLATYNGTLNPQSDASGLAAYNYLINNMGFNADNIDVGGQSTIETGDFTGYDLVLYTGTYPRDATNVLNQNVPFVTCSVGEADEMGIGTGEQLMHWTSTDAFVVDNTHNITSSYPLGLSTLQQYMWMDATMACGNGRVLVDAYGVIRQCPLACLPQAEMIDTEVSTKNRFVSVATTDAGRDQAIRVRFVDLPSPFNVWNYETTGQDFYAGVPREVCENSGKGLETPPEECPSALPADTFWAAPLLCDKGAAHYMDWRGRCDAGTCVGGLIDGAGCLVDDECVEVVHFYHEGLVPGGTYDIQVVDETCLLQDESSYSAPLIMIQSKWGDVCGPGPGGACSGVADGTVDVTNDVLGVLDKFANVNYLQKARADLEPGDDGVSNSPDFKVNVANDVLYCLDAFTGAPYPFAPGDPCNPG